MADLRIVDAPEIPTENITGEEKLPTGGSGNYSISLDSLADYTKTKKNLADNTSVDGKVSGVRQELDAHIEDFLNPHQVTKGQIGLGNVDNTADADKPVSNSTQATIISAVAPKADKTYVDGQLALKANKADVDSSLSTKADRTYVDNRLAVKSDKTYVDDQLTLKVDKTEIVEQLSLKSDKTYVDNQLSTKSDKNYTDSQLLLKADKTYVDTQDSSLQSQINQKATAEYVDNALSNLSTVASKFYPTLVAANADIANISVNQVVNIGEVANGGLWYKATSGATSLTKSAYDPLNQSKIYTDSKIKTYSIYSKVDCYVESVLDANGFTRVKMQSKSGQAYFYDSRIAENNESIAELNATVKGVEIYKKIQGTAVVYIDENGYTRLKEKSVDGVFESYTNSKVKQLMAGSGISLLETSESITIEASDIVYETPNEYVLCLVIGQSNNTTEGGNKVEAPVLPTGVCLIWDNTYSTLGDINDSPQKATVAPAMALEFYKQTGMGLIVVNSAVGASAMSELAAGVVGRSWDVTGTLRQPAIDRLNACKSYLDTNNYCYQMGFVSWSQGEQDGAKIADNTITVNDYKSAFTTFIEFIKTNVGQKVPFIITRTAYRTADNVGYKAVRDAQMEFSHNIDGIYMGYTGTTKFFSRNLMYDSVHYNQNGKNVIGTAIGKISSKLSAGVN